MESKLPILDFPCNFNGKLFCTVFTTIRLRNDDVYVPGALFEQTLKFKPSGTVEILEVKNFTIDQLNDYMSFIDLGVNKSEALKILQAEYLSAAEDPEQQFSYILLRRTQPDIQLNTQL